MYVVALNDTRIDCSELGGVERKKEGRRTPTTTKSEGGL